MTEGNYIHKMDQGIEGIRDMAQLMAVFYLKLIDEGVPEQQAGSMATAYVAGTMTNMRGSERRRPQAG